MKLFRNKNERSEKSVPVRTREKNKKNKMLAVRKRQVAAVSLILLIGIAGYLNLSLKSDESDPGVSVMYTEASKRLGEAKMVNGEQTEEEAEKQGVTNNTQDLPANYFENARLEREKTRGETMEMLTEILNTTGAEQEAKEEAQKRITQLAQFSESEVAAEQMICAKGYGDCVVFMGENVTSVAVKTNGLNEIDAAVITDIVAQSGVVSANQVKIVEIKTN